MWRARAVARSHAATAVRRGCCGGGPAARRRSAEAGQAAANENVVAASRQPGEQAPPARERPAGAGRALVHERRLAHAAAGGAREVANGAETGTLGTAHAGNSCARARRPGNAARDARRVGSSNAPAVTQNDDLQECPLTAAARHFPASQAASVAASAAAAPPPRPRALRRARLRARAERCRRAAARERTNALLCPVHLLHVSTLRERARRAASAYRRRSRLGTAA